VKRGGPSLHQFVMREAASTGQPKRAPAVHACSEFRVDVGAYTFCGIRVRQIADGKWVTVPAASAIGVSRRPPEITCRRCERSMI
jgi:hypothetical protein